MFEAARGHPIRQHRKRSPVVAATFSLGSPADMNMVSVQVRIQAVSYSPDGHSPNYFSGSLPSKVASGTQRSGLAILAILGFPIFVWFVYFVVTRMKAV